MNEAFRPHESASIDEGLRTRLEGTVELLEDSLPLLDSLMYLVSRAGNSEDDLAALHECVNQLPRIDEAIDRANKHEQAVALTQAVGARKRRALLAANERLVTLGREEESSLRAAIGSLLERVRRQGSQPRVGELRLMESPGLAWRESLLGGGVLMTTMWLACEYGFGGGNGFGWNPTALALCAMSGAMGALTILFSSARTPPWVVLPDRLFIPAPWPRLSRELSPSEIQRVSAGGEGVKLELANEVLELRCSEPAKFVTTLRLIGSRWLSGLMSPARPFMVVDAVDQSTAAEGRALLTEEGVLFVPNDRCALLLKALAVGELPLEPALDEVLILIAHLPRGRSVAVAEHLANAAEVLWLDRESLNRRLQLNLTSETDRARAATILEGLAP